MTATPYQPITTASRSVHKVKIETKNHKKTVQDIRIQNFLLQLSIAIGQQFTTPAKRRTEICVEKMDNAWDIAISNSKCAC